MNTEKILLAHGAGGKLSQRLINELILPEFKNPILELLEDSAVFNIGKRRIAFTTDSYVVNPIFFSGGDIGRLAVCGTVNDLSMSGAKPLYVSASFIIEEGFPQSDLLLILRSMRKSADEAGIKIVCGDTKVVEKGSVDKIFITTSGIGLIDEGVYVSPNRIKAGDCVLLSGTIGDHGIAIISQRQGFEFSSEICSDTAPLNHLVASMIESFGDDIHTLRDPTRGGLANTLNEFTLSSNLGIKIYEDKIPIQDGVRGACELLGFDPFYIANEGKFVAIVHRKAAQKVLSCMKRNNLGVNAEIIGEVTDEHNNIVSLVTRIGGTRIIDMLTGEQIPRIC